MDEFQKKVLSGGVNSNFQTLPTPNLQKGYTSALASIILIASTICTGVLYIILQWFRQKSVQDSIFVSMLIAATMILVFGIIKLKKYIVDKGLKFSLFLLSYSDSSKGYENYVNLIRSVFNYRGMTISGVVYGVIIGAAPFYLGIWNGDLLLKVSLSLFMFSVNYVAGCGLYGLVIFIHHSLKMGKMININLWEVNNPSIEFFFGATRQISILTSIYISICITSILFSLINIGNLIIAYSLFTATIIISSLIMPPLPVIQKLKDAKANAILEIDKQLHLSFYKNLSETKSTKSEVDYDKVKTLLELREKVDGINIWPFRMKSFVAGFSVIFFSSIPILLQLFLKKLFE